MHDVVAGYSGAVYGRRFERRFTSRITAESRKRVGGLEAYEATIEVTDVDRLHYVANNVDQVIAIVAVRLPNRVCPQGDPLRCAPALVALGCEREPVDAPACRRDLDKLLGAITWPTKR
jgi:hypothetical protein